MSSLAITPSRGRPASTTATPRTHLEESFLTSTSSPKPTSWSALSLHRSVHAFHFWREHETVSLICFHMKLKVRMDLMLG